MIIRMKFVVDMFFNTISTGYFMVYSSYKKYYDNNIMLFYTRVGLLTRKHNNNMFVNNFTELAGKPIKVCGIS